MPCSLLMGLGSEVSRREGPGLTLSAFGPQPVFSELCELKETIISSAPNLEYRDNLPCLGRKELCPVSDTGVSPGNILGVIIGRCFFENRFTKNISERVLTLIDS